MKLSLKLSINPNWYLKRFKEISDKRCLLPFEGTAPRDFTVFHFLSAKCKVINEIGDYNNFVNQNPNRVKFCVSAEI